MPFLSVPLLGPRPPFCFRVWVLGSLLNWLVLSVSVLRASFSIWFVPFIRWTVYSPPPSCSRSKRLVPSRLLRALFFLDIGVLSFFSSGGVVLFRILAYFFFFSPLPPCPLPVFQVVTPMAPSSPLPVLHDVAGDYRAPRGPVPSPGQWTFFSFLRRVRSFFS